MTIKELLKKKVNQLNKLNEELEFNRRVNLVLEEGCMKPIRIYKNSDLKEISDTYIDEITNKVLNEELQKYDKTTYLVPGTEIEIYLEEVE